MLRLDEPDDEKWMKTVKPHKAVNTVIRTKETFWFQRLWFNFCSRRLQLSVTCSS